MEGDDAKEEKIEVRDFVTNEVWNRELLLTVSSEEMIEYIIEEIIPLHEGYNNDVP